MRLFTYVVKDEEGLHARLLVKESLILALGIKKGEEITVTVEGNTENEDCEIVKQKE